MKGALAISLLLLGGQSESGFTCTTTSEEGIAPLVQEQRVDFRSGKWFVDGTVAGYSSSDDETVIICYQEEEGMK